MGIYDRDYSHEGFRGMGGRPQMRIGFPKLTPIVKNLLIANAVVFLLQSSGMGNFLEYWFTVHPESTLKILQVWRLLSYQFLHANVLHILFNMLGLYFLGPTLEKHWGSKRFLIFYLSCGVAGGLFYTFLAAFKLLPVLPMLGASGAILGMFAACAILFPRFVVFIFVFPVPIRVAVGLFTFLYVANLLRGGPNAGGDAAHLAGMAAGAIYVFYPVWREKITFKHQKGKWDEKIRRQRGLQIEVDRILDKLHTSGISSLSRGEKKILQEATRLEQAQNKS